MRRDEDPGPLRSSAFDCSAHDWLQPILHLKPALKSLWNYHDLTGRLCTVLPIYLLKVSPKPSLCSLP